MDNVIDLNNLQLLNFIESGEIPTLNHYQLYIIQVSFILFHQHITI